MNDMHMPAFPNEDGTSSSEGTDGTEAFAAELGGVQETGTQSEQTIPTVDGTSIDYSSAFEGYSQEQQQALADLLTLMRESPSDAAPILRELAGVLGPEEIAEVKETLEQGTSEVDIPEADPTKSMKEQFEEWMSERDSATKAQAERDRLATEVEKKIDALGYKAVSEDAPASPDRLALYVLAANRFQGDIDRAHAHIQEWKQSVFTEMKNQISANNEGFAPNPGHGSAAEPGVKRPSTFAEATKALMAEFQAQQ